MKGQRLETGSGPAARNGGKGRGQWPKFVLYGRGLDGRGTGRARDWTDEGLDGRGQNMAHNIWCMWCVQVSE